MTSRLDLAAEKGCDGVEPDNVQASITRQSRATNSCLALPDAWSDPRVSCSPNPGGGVRMPPVGPLHPLLLVVYSFETYAVSKTVKVVSEWLDRGAQAG